MLNKLVFIGCLIGLCYLSGLQAAVVDHVQITGIDGTMLQNVQRRLTELYSDKSIRTESLATLESQIAVAMQPYGHFKPHITLKRESKNNLIVHINQGPSLKVTTLTLKLIGEGEKNPKLQSMVATFPLKAGQTLNTIIYEDAKEKLLTTAETEGYLHASYQTAQILIDKQQYTAKITLVFDTGPLYYFGQVQFDPTYISPKLLQRYIPFHPGHAYSSEQLATFNAKLSASGYFKRVDIKPRFTEERDIPVNVHLEPSKRITYSLGAGYGTDTGPRGLVGLHVVPVNRAGHKFNAVAQGSLEENALQAQYIIPGLDPSVNNFSLSGSLTNLDYDSGKSNAALLSIAQQHVYPHFQRILSLNGLSDRYNYTGYAKTTESLFYPKAIFSWNNSSDPLFTPTGYNVTLNGLAATKALLSPINLAQISVDGKAAITIAPLRTRFYLHGIQGVTVVQNVNQIPLSVAQLLGGTPNLKGYSYNSLGPGKIISYAGIELQKETFNKWYFLGFFDSGDVYNPGFSQFKYDAGIGLMWVSPVGPIKIGIAQAITNHFERIPGRTPKLVVNMGPDIS